MDAVCEDLPGAMDDRDRWREKGKSVLSARLDDDDDDEEDIYIYILNNLLNKSTYGEGQKTRQ